MTQKVTQKVVVVDRPPQAFYSQVTNEIEVSVQPTYLEEHSRPCEGIYVWSYEISIANRSTHTVQLLNRHWRICNAHGQMLEVKGPGVVGDQPVLHPGASYAYCSLTNLATPSGIMFGSYQMVDEGGASIEVAIPAFSLDSPDQYALLN